MKLGYIGLGKMGFNMVVRLIEKGHEVVVFDKERTGVRKISNFGAITARSLKSLTSSLDSPRLIWMMVPHQVVDSIIQELLPFLQEGDTIIDGGNSHYKESVRRAGELEKIGVNFLDVGVSGGPSGARTGACIMIGGRKALFARYRNLFRDLSVRGGYALVGKHGAGHFVKMVHNGIEYGMMQAIAEGFALMKASPFMLELTRVANLYGHRSVIESRLLGWLKKAYQQYGDDLNMISGTVSHSGEGGWTVEAAKEFGTPVTAIEDALNFRIKSQYNPSYTGQILSAMRNQFGGHEVRKEELL